MATKNIVPRANNEGCIGTSAKRWANGYFTDINASGDLSVTGTITGDLTGNVTGDVTGNVTGDVTGNADTATNATNDGNGNNIVNTYLPAVVGAVVAFAGSTSPDGWLLCDGSAVSRTTYAALYAVIGTSYGSGDGSTTFNLPNLVDKFIEGSATAGTVKNAGLPNITGTFWARKWDGGTEVVYTSSTGGAFYDGGNASATDSISANSTKEKNNIMQFDASRSSSIYGNSTTVQPPALTMRYIIKY